MYTIDINMYIYIYMYLLCYTYEVKEPMCQTAVIMFTRPGTAAVPMQCPPVRALSARCSLCEFNIAMENGHLQLTLPLKRVVFHSYVKLPEDSWDFPPNINVRKVRGKKWFHLVVTSSLWVPYTRKPRVQLWSIETHFGDDNLIVPNDLLGGLNPPLAERGVPKHSRRLQLRCCIVSAEE